MKMKVTIIAIPFLVVLVDLTRAQLNLPEMPGPPYPDKFGNNRWGVKYDPRVHGRGRNEHSSAPSSSATWGGHGPQYSPPTRYRGAPPPSPPQRNKWSSALKPLVSRSPLFSKSKNKRNRRPARPKGSLFDPTSDSFYKNPYSSKSIDGYVKNYLNTYNTVSKFPPDSPTHMVNIQNFAKPTNLERFRPFSRNDNRRSLTSDKSSSSSSSLKDSYLLAAGLSGNGPTYRTLDPQEGFFGPKISKKKSDFAKTLVNIYNDYKPGAENNANSDSAISAATDAVINSAVSGDDDYSPSLSSHPPPSRNRPRPLSSGPGPTYIERPFKRPRGPPSSSRGPPPPPPRSYSSGPLSSLDLYEDIPSYTSKGPYSSFGSSGGSDYSSDSPMIITSSGGSPYSSSPSGPVTRVRSYMSGGPSHSSPYSSSFDTFEPSEPSSPFSSSPFSLGGPPPPPPPFYSSSPFAHAPPPQFASSPLAQPPHNYLPAAYPNMQILPVAISDKSKRKKNRLQQHTPMNVIRGLLGRGERRRHRDRDHDDDEIYKPAYAAHYPVISLAPPIPPPQYTYNPLVNTLTGPLDYRPSLYSSGYPYPPPPPPHGHGPPLSPLAAGILNLRDSLAVGLRDRQQRPPPSSHQADSSNDNKKEGAPMSGHVTQHVQDWPRIFTAMGTSVDAVAGGIHAVRKEISKMTGQTVAKGLMMSGSAVHEVSKGMAQMITKLSTI